MSMKLKGLRERPNGKIQVRNYVDGGEITEITKFRASIPSEVKKAIRYQAAKQARLDAGLPDTDDESSLRFEDAVKRYKESFNVAASTLGGYDSCLNTWVPVLKHLRVNAITKAHVQKGINEFVTKKGQPVSPSTKNNRKSALSQLFVKLGISPNPVTDIDTRANKRAEELKEPDQFAVSLDNKFNIRSLHTEEERSRILNELEGAYRVYFALLWGAGLRPLGEPLGLKWSDYDPDEGTILVQRKVCTKSKAIIYRLKSGKSRLVYLPKWTQDILNNYTETRFQKSFIFLNKLGEFHKDSKLMIDRWREVHETLGIRFRDAYTCRHYRACELMSNDVDTYARSAAQLGHSVEVHTRVYAKIVEDQSPENAYDKYQQDFNAPCIEA